MRVLAPGKVIEQDKCAGCLKRCTHSRSLYTPGWYLHMNRHIHTFVGLGYLAAANLLHSFACNFPLLVQLLQIE